MKTAIVCDWLTEIGGAEKVLLEIHKLFPDAPIYTSQYRPKSAIWFARLDVRTGWLNIFPRALRKFLSPLRYRYFSHLDLSAYDLVISSSNAEAKAVKTRADAVHISYQHGPPVQYYWGMYDDYIKNPGFGKLNWLARLGLKFLAGGLRKIDYKCAQNPDFLVANSNYVRDEIKKYYGRAATVIHPGVDVKKIRELARENPAARRDGFIITGRQANWKHIDLAVKACLKTGDKLLVVGDGPEHDKLVKLATGNDNVQFLPRYNDVSEIVKYFCAARAFIFPSIEPFGITPIEAMACGTPVLALKRGGSLDFISPQNGRFFEQQTVESLVAALEKIKKTRFDQKTVEKAAERFDTSEFKKRFLGFIDDKLA
ncbi:MAG: glycosyltransferase [Candidatus Nomurabacteria bacterium]|nr:glycosyltransferase [Candidatus Nomurabacteria bacterium]